MSYGIIRMQKFSAGSVKGIEIHDTRQKGLSHTNQDIDWGRSNQNYDLHEKNNQSYYRAIKTRIAELDLRRAVRKDAKVMCQAMVTSDKTFFDGLSEEQQRQYFKDSYGFLCERYGKGNIISATVHLDERTPHMHVNFVPVTADGRLSAKDVIGGRDKLTNLQTEFHKQVAQKYGLERGLEGSRTKHQAVAEYKTSTAKAELAQIQEQKNSMMQNASNLRFKAIQIKSDINALESKRRALKDTLEALEAMKTTLTATDEEKTIRLVNRVNRILEKLTPEEKERFMYYWKQETQKDKGKGGLER